MKFLRTPFLQNASGQLLLAVNFEHFFSPVFQFIINLDCSKATPVGGIPIDMLKQTIDIHLPVMTQIINMSIDNNCYPDDLKLAEVSPVFKKKDDLG